MKLGKDSDLMNEHNPIAGEACPVLLPVGQYGEQLCIAVIGAASAHGPWARAVVPRVPTCLPADLGHAVQTFGALVVADFLEWCTRGKSMRAWSAPLGGLRMGDWMQVEAFDFEDLIRVSLMMAAFSDPGGLAEVRGSTSLHAAPRLAEESRFLNAVREEVQRVRPALAKGFQRTLSLVGKVSAGEIDFVGNHYVTCYAAVNPKSRATTRVQTAAAALWRLARVRDAFGFASPATIELTAWVPPAGLPIYSEREYDLVSETVAELRAQASKEQLDVYPAVDANMACRRLVQLEIEQAPLVS